MLLRITTIVIQIIKLPVTLYNVLLPSLLQLYENQAQLQHDICVTVHHQYNDVNNQQDATTFSFINLFKSALHDSDDKFTHPKEHFLTVYTAFGTMHRYCSRPVPRGTCRLQCRCIVPKAVYRSKSAPKDGRICRPKHVGLI